MNALVRGASVDVQLKIGINSFALKTRDFEDVEDLGCSSMIGKLKKNNSLQLLNSGKAITDVEMGYKEALPHPISHQIFLPTNSYF
ncbi:hypothetical protein CEXT_541131 [Caerostris extrusa]|uniref:Uncharacterized protein n=1 Tax=Caerostris extrusa TaxID=172846 RepID=A0AAV4MZE1_CAEEX|nr:hypothetical protein CEXT_541131 [Caerostris extrusa]